MNYYTFDSIKRDSYGYGTVWGYRGKKITEVYFLSPDDTDENLARHGYAKCDAHDWNETMVVEETAWASLL